MFFFQTGRDSDTSVWISESNKHEDVSTFSLGFYNLKIALSPEHVGIFPVDPVSDRTPETTAGSSRED